MGLHSYGDTVSGTYTVELKSDPPTDGRAKKVWNRNKGIIGEVTRDYEVTVSENQAEGEFKGNSESNFLRNMSSPSLGISISKLSFGLEATTIHKAVSEKWTFIDSTDSDENPYTTATVSVIFNARLIVTGGVSVSAGDVPILVKTLRGFQFVV